MQEMTLNAETLRALGTDTDLHSDAEEASICWSTCGFTLPPILPPQEPEQPVCACPPVTNPPQAQ